MAKEARIKVPEDLEGLLVTESCEDFDEDGYFLTENQFNIFKDIVENRQVSEELKKMGISYMNSTLLYGPPGTGKAQPLSSLVLTPSGYRKMGDLKVGDSIYAANGNLTTIKGIYPQGKKAVYRVAFSDKTSCRCSADHLWTVKVMRMEGNKRLPEEEKTLELKDLIEGVRSSGGQMYSVPFIGRIERMGEDLAGYDERLQELNQLLDEKAMTAKSGIYGRASVVYKADDESDAEHVADLVRSLGGYAVVNDHSGRFTVRLSFPQGMEAQIYAANQKQKDLLIQKGFRPTRRRITDIIEEGEEECQCIYIDDPSHLYVTDNYIVTHNTTFARYVAHSLDMDLAYLNFAKLIDGVFGNTARNLGKIFRFMGDQECVFLLDEIDCIAVKRGTESAATGGELSRITITLMQEMDYYRSRQVNAILLAATNRIDQVDDALKTRFSIKRKLESLTNDEKFLYITQYLSAHDIPYDEDNIYEYISETADKTNRITESDMVRCTAEWIRSGKKKYVLNTVRDEIEIL